MATMDHTDIRGLVTHTSSVRRGAAYTLGSEIIAMDAHVVESRIPLIGPAHRVAPALLGVELRLLGGGVLPPMCWPAWCAVSSGRHLHLARDVPEKTGELASDG